MSNEQIKQHSLQPTIKLNDFEGPLDLLLHLIRESKMDIYDIEIVQITSQYMEYLHQMKAHQLEVAGEYFVLAATLMDIKSQLLLPQSPVLEEQEPTEEPFDPRQELVEQLLEYQRYKKAAANLKDRESYRQQEYTRPAMRLPQGLIKEQTAPGVSIDQLQTAFQAVLKRHRLAQPLTETIETEKISVAQRMQAVIKEVTNGPLHFNDLFDGDCSRNELVTTFLAVLELAKHQAILLEQNQLFAPIILVEGPKSEEYRSK